MKKFQKEGLEKRRKDEKKKKKRKREKKNFCFYGQENFFSCSVFTLPTELTNGRAAFPSLTANRDPGFLEQTKHKRGFLDFPPLSSTAIEDLHIPREHFIEISFFCELPKTSGKVPEYSKNNFLRDSSSPTSAHPRSEHPHESPGGFPEKIDFSVFLSNFPTG